MQTVAIRLGKERYSAGFGNTVLPSASKNPSIAPNLISSPNRKKDFSTSEPLINVPLAEFKSRTAYSPPCKRNSACRRETDISGTSTSLWSPLPIEISSRPFNLYKNCLPVGSFNLNVDIMEDGGSPGESCGFRSAASTSKSSGCGFPNGSTAIMAARYGLRAFLPLHSN